jgi:hypothetical protein
LRINVYGCGSVPPGRGYPFISDNSEKCDPDSEEAYGWIAVAYFLFTVVLGGLLLPTVLIGIVAISFERAWSKYSEEKIMEAILTLLIRQIEELMPEWWSTDRLQLIKTTYSMLNVRGASALDLEDVENVLMHLVKTYIAAVPYDVELNIREESLLRSDIRDL